MGRPGSGVGVVVGVLALVVVGVGAVAWLTFGSSSPEGGHLSANAPVVAEVTMAPPASSPSTSPATPPPTTASASEVLSDFEPLAVDVDGDGTPDVVTAIDAGSSAHYALFSGRDARELSRTPPVEEPNRALAVVVGRRLLTASQTGQLTGYGLADGKQQWTTALGARVSAFCGAKTDDALLVVTDDGRKLNVDLTTGRQSETKDPCKTRLSRPAHRDDPRDRHDYDAPLGTESYHCGGVRVMGSENYTVADQCLAKARIDTDRLDGFIGHRLWKVGQNWLSFGIRKPGAYVPMLALVVKGKLAWKQVVPLDNPLDAQTGSPRQVALSGDLVSVTYQLSKERSQFATAFAVADGTRRWHVALPKDVQNVSHLTSAGNRVFIQGSDRLLILDAADGKLLARVGKAG